MGKTFRKGKLIGRDPAARNKCYAATANRAAILAL